MPAHAGAAASASSRCWRAPSTCAPPTDVGGVPARRRSGSPARRRSSTADASVEFAVAAAPPAHRRRRTSRRTPTGRLDPVGARRRRRRHYGEAPLEPVADGRLRPRDRRRHDDGRARARRPARRPRSVEVVALENPQRFGGSDVMNRISLRRGRRAAASCGRRCAGRSTASCRTSTSAAASTGARSTRSSSSATRRCATSSSGSTSRRSASGRTSRSPSSSCSPGDRDTTALTRARPRARRARCTRRAASGARR